MKIKIEKGMHRHLEKSLKVALSAADEAGVFLRKKFGNFNTLNKKADASLVTEADKGSEKIIVRKIRKAFPHDQIIGEESGFSAGKPKKTATILGNFRWHIDPLDGTTNFVHSFPMFCISIGLEFEDNQMVLGVIYNPISKDLFYGSSGKGAFRNKKRIKVSDCTAISESMLTTGFSSRRDILHDRELQTFSRVVRQSRAIRRIGSAALDLSLVSCGQFDGFWERHLSSWDVAAGIAILQEAGGIITKLDGSPYRLGDESILATNAKLHKPLIAIMNER